MKTLPARPADISAPPEGYVYLGKRTDIKVPESWDTGFTGKRDFLAYAFYSFDLGCKWITTAGTYGTNPLNHYAAFPDTPLYNLNKDRLPMNKPIAPAKTLKYKIFARHNSLVAVQITEQSHRKDEFGIDKSNKFGKLGSMNHPQKETFYWVRGDSKKLDDNPLLLTDSQFSEFEKEVAAYNAYFSKPAILKTVFFEYSAGSVRGYRRVEVIREDETYLEGLDSKKGEYRKFLKSKIVGNIDTVKA